MLREEKSRLQAASCPRPPLPGLRALLGSWSTASHVARPRSASWILNPRTRLAHRPRAVPRGAPQAPLGVPGTPVGVVGKKKGLTRCADGRGATPWRCFPELAAKTGSSDKGKQYFEWKLRYVMKSNTRKYEFLQHDNCFYKHVQTNTKMSAIFPRTWKDADYFLRHEAT